MATSFGISLRHIFGFGHILRIHTENMNVLHVCAKETSPSESGSGAKGENCSGKDQNKIPLPTHVPAAGSKPLELRPAQQKTSLLFSSGQPRWGDLFIGRTSPATKPCRMGKIARVANTCDCQASSGHLLSRVSEPLPWEQPPECTGRIPSWASG